MKPGVLCCWLLLMSGCLSSEGPREVYEYVVTWTCLSESCERADELERIDTLVQKRRDFLFTSTQDESFREEAFQIFSDLLPPGCTWMYYLSLLGHELEPSRFCLIPGGFELEVAIPNEAHTTPSVWLVEGRDVKFL